MRKEEILNKAMIDDLSDGALVISESAIFKAMEEYANLKLKEADSKAVRLEEFIKTHIINYNKSPLTAQEIQREAKKLFEQENK